jgi:AcrR family transcriptional regulator
MLGETVPSSQVREREGAGDAASPVERRHAAARAEILAAARDLARRDGLAGLSLRDLAAAVGMKAPSLYSYFASKAAILDELFASGYRELDAVLAAVPRTGELRTDLAAGFRAFLAFCTDDLPRYQLLFTRVIPGWTPSEAAYAVSRASYARMATWLAELGITDPRALDLWTGLTSGFAAQQVANDPGGDRWVALFDDAVEMFVRQIEEVRP